MGVNHELLLDPLVPMATGQLCASARMDLCSQTCLPRSAAVLALSLSHARSANEVAWLLAVQAAGWLRLAANLRMKRAITYASGQCASSQTNDSNENPAAPEGRTG